MLRRLQAGGAGDGDRVEPVGWCRCRFHSNVGEVDSGWWVQNFVESSPLRIFRYRWSSFSNICRRRPGCVHFPALRSADTAPTRPRSGGRNAYQFYTEQMNSEAIEHLKIRNGSRRADQRGIPAALPAVINLADGKVVRRRRSPAPPRAGHPVTGALHLGSPRQRFGRADRRPGAQARLPAGRRRMARYVGLLPIVMAVNPSAVQFPPRRHRESVPVRLANPATTPTIWSSNHRVHPDPDTDRKRSRKRCIASRAMGMKLSIDDFGIRAIPACPTSSASTWTSRRSTSPSSAITAKQQETTPPSSRPSSRWRAAEFAVIAEGEDERPVAMLKSPAVPRNAGLPLRAADGAERLVDWHGGDGGSGRRRLIGAPAIDSARSERTLQRDRAADVARRISDGLVFRVKFLRPA